MLIRRACASLLASCTVACTSPPPPRPPLPFSLADLPAIKPGHGALQGYVYDKTTGARTAGALVILECSCLAGSRETETDARGIYSFDDLPPGRFLLKAAFNKSLLNRTIELPNIGRIVIRLAIDPHGPSNRFH